MTAQAATFPEIEALTKEWEGHGTGGRDTGDAPTKKRRSAPARPRPLIGPGGHAIYIGRSGAQNDLVTFDLAGPDDTWLHARGVAGSHVIVRWRIPGADEDQRTIEAAAALAAYYSAARGNATVEVDVTRRRYVRKIKGTGPGLVTYRNERTIAVRPADEAMLEGVLTSSAE
jgi:predicted ribosome quality control (RQC) complex YloA/Tae2 family protein